MNKLVIVFICLLLVGCQELRHNQSVTPAASELLRLHNWDRTTSLKMSPQLNFEAQKWAEKMARKERLVHSDLSMIPFNYRGENIASGQTTPNQVMDSWRASSGHYKNITDTNFTHVGFGKAIGRRGKTYWCVMFGG